MIVGGRSQVRPSNTKGTFMNQNYTVRINWRIFGAVAAAAVILSVAAVGILNQTGVLTTRQANEIRKDVDVAGTALAEVLAVVEALESTPLSAPDPDHDPTSGDTRPTPDSIFNTDFVTIPADLKAEIRSTRREFTIQQVEAAWQTSWAHETRIIPEDTKFWVVRDDLFHKALPHLGTNLLRYISDYWVCRSYAGLFVVVYAAEMESDAVGKILDYTGRHSYSFVFTYHQDTGLLIPYVVEPQADGIVTHRDPARHYDADDHALGILGG